MSVEIAPQRTTLERSLPGYYYTSPRVFEQEKERIFFREWFCGGREEQLPNPGDYLVLDVLGESVLVVRSREGELSAFYNVCAHRGCQLVLAEPAAARAGEPPMAGAAPGPHGAFRGVIRCPYHSWTYNLTGELRGSPFLAQGPDFDRTAYSLHPVGLDRWGGFFFLNLSPDEAAAPGLTLGAQLGAIPERYRRYPLEGLRVGRRITYEVAANWKVIMENYNECYHCAGVHPELCELVPAFRDHGGNNLDWEHGIPHRDGAYTFTWSGTSNRALFAGLSEEEQTRHKGELIYPNLLVSFSSDHIAAFTLWPRAPHHTTISCDFLFDPAEMAKESFDPSDAVDFWDLVNRQDWAICAGVQRGMTSRSFTVGYYAPMEDASLDIRRYLHDRLGPVTDDDTPAR